MNNARTPRILLATAAIASASLAAAIDTWEPVKNGTSIPTAAQQANHTTSEHWIGYSDGRVYAKLSSNSWMRLDSAVNPGGRGTFGICDRPIGRLNLQRSAISRVAASASG